MRRQQGLLRCTLGRAAVALGEGGGMGAFPEIYGCTDAEKGEEGWQE